MANCDASCNAVSANAPANLHFYTQVLGMRLVKKTVNQDEPSVYHLFYADAQGDAMEFVDHLKAQLAQASSAGDHEAVAELTEQMTDLAAAEKKPAEPPKK